MLPDTAHESASAFRMKLAGCLLLAASSALVAADSTEIILPYKSRVAAFMSFDSANFLTAHSKSSFALATVTQGPVQRVLGIDRQGAYLDDVRASFDIPVSITEESLGDATIGGWFFPMSTSVPNSASDEDARIVVMTNAISHSKSGRGIILQRGDDGQTYWALCQPGFLLVSDVVALPYKWAAVSASFSSQHEAAMISVNGVTKQARVVVQVELSSNQSPVVHVGGTQDMGPLQVGFYGVVDNLFVYSAFIRTEQVPAILASVDSVRVPSPAASSAGYALQFQAEQRSMAFLPELPRQFACLHDFNVAFSFKPGSGSSLKTQGVFALGDFDAKFVQLQARLLDEQTLVQLSLTFHGIAAAPLEWIPDCHLPVGDWSHIWMTWNGTRLSLAVNDTTVETWSRAAVLLPEYQAVGCGEQLKSSFLLGASPLSSDSAGEFLTGALDEVRLQFQGQEPGIDAASIAHTNSSSLLNGHASYGLHFRMNEGFGQSAAAECSLVTAECGSIWLDLIGGPSLGVHSEGESGSPPHWIQSKAVWDDWLNATEDIVHEFALNASVVHALLPGEPLLLLTAVPARSKVVRASAVAGGITSFDGVHHQVCPVLLKRGGWEQLQGLLPGDTVQPGELLCFAPPPDVSPLSEELRYKVALRNQTVLSDTDGVVSIVVHPVTDGIQLVRPNTVRVKLHGLSVYDPDEVDVPHVARLERES